MHPRKQLSTGLPEARRPRKTGLACAVLIAFMLAQPLLAVGTVAHAAAARTPDVRIALSKDAYWYETDGLVGMVVTLDNATRQAVRGVDVRLRIQPRNTSRADLDNTFDGKPAKVYRQTTWLGRNLTLNPGNNAFKYQLQLDPSRFEDGVYPLTIDALRAGAPVANIISELIIFSTKNSGDITPLNLSIVFDTLEPPHRGPDGTFQNEDLAAECSTSSKNTGWLTNLLWLADTYPEVNLSFSMSPMLTEDIRNMASGYDVKSGDSLKHVGAGSREALDAAATLSGLRRLAQSPHNEVMPQPYASPNLESLVSLKWTADARDQLTAGRKMLEKDLDTAVSDEFSSPPGQLANSRVLRALGPQAGQFMLLSSSLLERSSAGKRLLKGSTLGQPVDLAGGAKGGKVQALFEDARLRGVFDRVSQSGDPSGVAQCILSELTNLYLERPDKLRDCTVVWPSTWRPSRQVLNEVMKAISGAPWLKTTTLAQSIMNVPSLENDPLDIPEPGPPSNDYFSQVARARSQYQGFKAMVKPDNLLLAPMARDLAYSESDVWSEWSRQIQGLSYASWVTGTVDLELAKVQVPQTGTFSISSSDKTISLSIVNGTSYPIRATLTLASNGLTFPHGSVQKVTLEPKENVLEIPVTVKKQGRVRFLARVQTGDFILGEVDSSVLTSRFNTFAIMVVGGVLLLIGLLWVRQAAERRKAGKHRRGNVGNAEEGRGEEA